jgi:hypothetical protein
MLFDVEVDGHSLAVPSRTGRIWSERIAETLVGIERDDRFRKLVQIPSQNVGSIVHRVASPVQSFTISVR